MTGNLYKDLKEYFCGMLFEGVFYALPKGYALRQNSLINHFSKSLEIELLEKAYHYSVMTRSGYFKVCEDGSIDEFFYGDDSIAMQKFILPMRELIKQMQQYYTDHNLVGDKEC